MKVTGLVYLHSIGQNRMAGSALLGHKQFRSICGPRALRRVVMASTQWETVSYDPRAGDIREKDLQAFWKETLDQGAIYMRIGATEQERKHDTSAIINHILRKHAVATQIQEELVEEGKRVGETEAAQHLRETLEERLGDSHKEDQFGKRRNS